MWKRDKKDTNSMPRRKQKQIIIQEELEHRILNGLACEWEEALWVLDSSYKDLMRKPLFSLSDTRIRLGHWSHEKREICLSRNLVLNHSWNSVVEVLVHEMAHQFADEVLGAYNELPHGPAFQRACHLLRANPKAFGKYKPLDERIFHKSSSLEDKIMVRIRKLMALAQSQNQHEAEAAMAKAHQFIKKYNVDLLTHEKDRNFVSVFVGRPALRHFREEYALARLLTDFYFVYGIWMPAYVLDKGKMGSVLEISGTMQNIEIAHYVYDFVRQSINIQWDAYNKDNGLNRYRKTDFSLGVIQGFCSKLKSQNQTKRKVNDKRALIRMEDPLLKKYTGYKYPRTCNVKGKALRHDHNILKDGVSVGKRLVISKGINEKARNKKLLIENKRAKSN